MAQIATVKALISSFENKDSEAHVWLDNIHGLVVGKYPAPDTKFDFSTESFVGIAAAKAKPVISMLGGARRITRKYEIETAEEIYLVGSATQALIQGLDVIEKLAPGTLDKLAARKKQSKRPVARNRTDLYDVHHPLSHSERLQCGFFVATNNKASEAIGVLREAASLGGLEDAFKVRRA